MFRVNTGKCSACGACVEVCPTGAIRLNRGKAVIDQALCEGCGACLQACEAGAISEILVPEVVKGPPKLAGRPRQPVSKGAVVASAISLAPVAVEFLSRIAERWLSPRWNSSRYVAPNSNGWRRRLSLGGSGIRGSGLGLGRGRRRRRRGRR